MKPEDIAFEPLGSLDEDAVKRRFIPFLKDFYRHRYEPLPGTTEIRFDNISQDGLIADGMMQFLKPDGKKFVCTYEATSVEKADEVVYTLNTAYFIWDCAAFSAFVTAVFYIANYVWQMPWLIRLGWAGNIGILFGVALIGFLGWYFVMRPWRKYRFIHAIAQFDRYNADDQWIALAEDVFPAPTNPYLIELKSQCIYKGYGLAVVPAEGNVRVLVAPSRLSAFGRNRKIVEWVTERDWYQRIQTVQRHNRFSGKLSPIGAYVTRPLQQFVWNPLRKRTGIEADNPLAYTTAHYQRFMSGQVIQKWIFIFSLLLVVPFVRKVLTYRDSVVDDLQPRRNIRGVNPEDIPNQIYLSDAEPVPYSRTVTGVTKQFPHKNESVAAERAPYTTTTTTATPRVAGIESDEEEDVPTLDISGDSGEKDPAPQPKTAPAVQKTNPKPPAKKSTAPAPVAATAPDYCTLLRKTAGWIVQDNFYTTRENAALRSKTLRDKGITAAAVGRDCVQKGTSGFIVWVGGIYADEEKAKVGKREYESLLKKHHLYKNRLLIRKL